MLKYFKCALQLLELLRKIVVLMNTIDQEQHTVYIYMLTIMSLVVPVLLL